MPTVMTRTFTASQLVSLEGSGGKAALFRYLSHGAGL
jgi:hypothetical protein